MKRASEIIWEASVKTCTYFRGEIIQEATRDRLIEIIHHLIWESEQRRQALVEAEQREKDK